MDTRLLEYFTTVAAEESVTEAAYVLRVAQSTVSVGIKSLERELGVKLFERNTRNLRISEAGQRLLEEARAILDGVERMRGIAGQSATGMRGRLRLGTFAAMEQVSRLPEALAAFREVYPNIDITLCASLAGSSGLQEDLLRGRLDMAFFALPTGAGLEAVELSSVAYVVLLPPGHRLEDRESVSLAELAEDDWIDVVPGYGNRVQVEQALRERGLSRHVAAEVSGLPSIPAFVARGIGIAVVPDLVAPDGCRTVNLVDPMPRWRLSLAMRKGAGSRPPIAAFADILRQSFREDRR